MQIAAIQPEVIVTLGKIATDALLGVKEPITRLRGQWQRYDQIPGDAHLSPPSYLLRFPKERIRTWEDMQQVMGIWWNMRISFQLSACSFQPRQTTPKATSKT